MYYTQMKPALPPDQIQNTEGLTRFVADRFGRQRDSHTFRPYAKDAPDRGICQQDPLSARAASCR